MKPRQKKSRTYYYFWGAATVAVFAGQIYVGSGFRRMAVTLQRILDAPLMIEVPDLIPRGRYSPLVPPSPDVEFLDFYDDNMARKVPPFDLGSGSPNDKVFCGIIFER